MKDKLIELIREVSIADKTYPEYVEALADKLIAVGVITVAREIFEEIEAIKGVGLLPSSWVKQFAELKNKYTEEGK